MKQTDLSRFQIPETASLLEALGQLDRAAIGLVIVTSAEGRVIGTLSDGDIRRALLHGATLDEPIQPQVHRDFLHVSPSVSRVDVLDMMQARVLRQIPVLGDDGRLVGLHLLHELLGRHERPNGAVIMAGGQGTRLRPLTERMPKPMI